MRAIKARDKAVADSQAERLKNTLKLLKKITGETGQVIDGKVFIGGLEVEYITYRQFYGDFKEELKIEVNDIKYDVTCLQQLGEIFLKAYGQDLSLKDSSTPF